MKNPTLLTVATEKRLSGRMVGNSYLTGLRKVCPSLETDSLHAMISDPFCVVAPHADTFDQQGITKSVR